MRRFVAPDVPEPGVEYLRAITRFLFRKRVINGEERWLEWARWEQRLVYHHNDGKYWEDVRWLS